MRLKHVFVWENLGPTHEDRLAAIEAAYPGETVAIQFAPSSSLYLWDGANEHAVPTVTLFDQWQKARGWKLAWKLYRACMRPGARNIYLCHYERWTILAAAMLLRLSGRRVFTMIDSKFDDYTRFVVREMGKSLFLSPYSGAMTASRRSRDYMRFLGFRRRPVAMGYDTISVARIRAQCGAPPAPDGLPHAARDFLIIARLVPKKNLALALCAYAAWRSQGGESRRLRILGSGPLEADLRAQADALGIAASVQFEGFLQTDMVSDALGSALCLILPSIEEQFGLVTIEAMAMGVPVLLSSNAGAADVMIDNGINGWIIDPHSPDVLTAAMKRLDEDEAGWAAMAAAARDASWRGDAAEFVKSVRTLSRLD